MTKTEFSTIKTDWTDLPLHQVLYEWIIKNISIPNDMSVIVAYVALIFIAWYTIMWLMRFIMGIIWPLFLIGIALIVFRILQFYEPEDLMDMTTKTLTIIADTIVRIRFIYNYTLHQSVRIYKNIQDCLLVFYYFLFGYEDSKETTKTENLQEIIEPPEIFHIN